jgi:two-component system, OmpR family, sensor kinase
VIRRRLVATIVALVTAILGVAGPLALSALRDRQVDEIDQQLRAVDRQAERYLQLRQDPDTRPPPLRDVYEPFPFVIRRTAYVIVDNDGTVTWSFPAGTAAQPEPLPDTTELPPPGQTGNVDAAGGDGPRYRVLTQALGGDSGTLVMGMPLAAVDDTLADVTEILLVTGGVALAAVAAAVWFSVRRGLRPIDQMVLTARHIADGDLTQRAPPTAARGEVAELRGALNTMLDRIEDAVDARVASEDRMRRFLADASHELRTPLTSIRGYAELHRRGATDPEAVTRGMARIEHEATRMGTLVDDLLLLARLDQDRPLDHEPLDITALATDATEAFRQTEPDRPITLTLPDRPVTITGDGPRLRQVLDNLLSNVRTHTDPDTPVEVTVTLTDDGSHAHAVLAVSDSGPGMTAEHAARAFERFYQADPHHPGSGLGLAIVAELVRAHGGTAQLDTEPGQGTTVTITLPLQPALGR